MNTIRLDAYDVMRVVRALNTAADECLCDQEAEELYGLSDEIAFQLLNPQDILDVKGVNCLNEDNVVVTLNMPNGKDCIDLICPVREGTFEYNCAVVKLDGKGHNTEPIGLNLVYPGHYT